MTHPGGRPTKFKQEYVKQASVACRMGATDADLADLFDVTITTIWNWKTAFPEFLDALKSDKEYADDRVERSFYQRAVGYSFDSVKIFNGQTGVVKVPYREHVPPDVAAGYIWLKNRRGWRDKQPDEIGNGGNKETVIRVIGGFPEAFENRSDLIAASK